jgi:hypothetical protein
MSLMAERKQSSTSARACSALGVSDFGALVRALSSVHEQLRRVAVSSVNRMLTVRNWLFGYYIVQFEQKGADRAEYGAAIFTRLSEKLRALGVRGCSVSALRDYRQFYAVYPQLGAVVLQEVKAIAAERIHQSPPGELTADPFWLLLRRPIRIHQEASGELQPVAERGTSPVKLLRHFSYSHFVELMRADNPLKRVFYETEGIKGNWSVPQLKRQIETLLYERTGMSGDKRELVDAVHDESLVRTCRPSCEDG